MSPDPVVTPTVVIAHASILKTWGPMLLALTGFTGYQEFRGRPVVDSDGVAEVLRSYVEHHEQLPAHAGAATTVALEAHVKSQEVVNAHLIRVLERIEDRLLADAGGK